MGFMDLRVSPVELTREWDLSFADLHFVNATPTGTSVGIMLDEVFLRFRDCMIFAPSRKEMERLVRSERQRFLGSFLGRVADRLHLETIMLMEASVTDPDALRGFLEVPGQSRSLIVQRQSFKLLRLKALNMPLECQKKIYYFLTHEKHDHISS